MKTDYSPAHAKLERMLEIIELLRPPGRRKSALANHFQCSHKTLSRYFKTLEQANMYVEEDEAGRCYIVEPLSRGIPVRLTPEEGEFLYDLINSAAPTHPLAAPVLSKLLFYTELDKRVKNTFRRTLPEVVQKLSHAMRSNRQISIREYYSASTGKIRERLLQPLNFSPNMNYLLAYEASENKRVNLKTDRIADVTILEATCTVLPDVEWDVFHIAANEERHEVSLLLNPLAYRLLIEQNQDTERHIAPSGNSEFPFRFTATLFNFLPIGRFVLGLPGSVVVEQPQALKEYLHAKINQFIV